VFGGNAAVGCCQPRLRSCCLFADASDAKLLLRAQFTALLRHGLVGDLTCLYDPAQRALHTLVALGPDVCGHGGLVHGGMSATVRLHCCRRAILPLS
jgi:hypothetical protein